MGLNTPVSSGVKDADLANAIVRRPQDDRTQPQDNQEPVVFLRVAKSLAYAAETRSG